LFDGYRPWSVTKIFWDVTPQDKKIFVHYDYKDWKEYPIQNIPFSKI